MKAGYYTGDVHVENSIPVGSCAKGSAKHSACCTAGGTNQVGRVVLQDLSQSRPDRWGPRCVGVKPDSGHGYIALANSP